MHPSSASRLPCARANAETARRRRGRMPRRRTAPTNRREPGRAATRRTVGRAPHGVAPTPRRVHGRRRLRSEHQALRGKVTVCSREDTNLRECAGMSPERWPCISYDGGRGCYVATSDPIAEIIGDYRAFAAMQRDRLVARGIDIAPYRSATSPSASPIGTSTSTSARCSSAMRGRTSRTSGTGVRSPRSCSPSRSMSSTGLRSRASN